MVGTVVGSSQYRSDSGVRLAIPLVVVRPCSDGYWPVQIEARDGEQAVAIA
jgi:hypothetical protein